MTNPVYKLRFWGVRGSIPTPIMQNLRYGGNTSCAALALSTQEYLILDCGTGIRNLGIFLQSIKPTVPMRFHILLSHYHFDHVAGLPFFQPLYDESSSITFHGFQSDGKSVREVLENLISPPYFPVSLAGAPAKIDYVTSDGSPLVFGDVRVSRLPLCHPNGSVSYRLEHGARRIVFATDHEHGDEKTDSTLLRFCEGADYLIYDATYLPAEYEKSRRGWGHSTWSEAVRMARAARVKTLVLFHHHPDRTDEELEAVLRNAREELPSTEIAREGMELPLSV